MSDGIDIETTVHISHEQMARLMSMRLVERRLNRYMQVFGFNKKITVSDASRGLARHPTLLKIIEDACDAYEQKECEKRKTPKP